MPELAAFLAVFLTVVSLIPSAVKNALDAVGPGHQARAWFFQLSFGGAGLGAFVGTAIALRKAEVHPWEAVLCAVCMIFLGLLFVFGFSLVWCESKTRPPRPEGRGAPRVPPSPASPRARRLYRRRMFRPTDM